MDAEGGAAQVPRRLPGRLDLGDQVAGRRVPPGEPDAGCLAVKAAPYVAPRTRVPRARTRAASPRRLDAPAPRSPTTTHPPRESRVCRLLHRSATIRHEGGLAAIPPVRRILRVEGSSSLLCLDRLRAGHHPDAATPAPGRVRPVLPLQSGGLTGRARPVVPAAPASSGSPPRRPGRPARSPPPGSPQPPGRRSRSWPQARR